MLFWSPVDLRAVLIKQIDFMKFRLIFTFLLFSTTFSFAQPYTAVTYNIRFSTESDGINQWENRKAWLVDQVKEISPDVMGTQEGLHKQISYLDSTLSDNDYVGSGREDGKTAGEYAAIFYKRESFKSLESDTFWLSETPDSVSKGWGANFERICTYTLLFDENSDQHLWVFNAHLDHESRRARIESVKLIWEYIQKLNTQDYPVIFMGDLNAVPDSPPIVYISQHLNDSKSISHNEPIGPVGTYNGFGVSHPLDRRIDYIFVNDDIAVQRYKVINEIKDNRTPSDHLPVVASFNIIRSNQ